MSTAAASNLSPAFPERAAWGTASKLRAWQATALSQYLESDPRDFLAVATPGAGKTTYALRVATIQTNLGLLYQEVGRLADAEVQHHQAVQLARQVNDGDNPNLAIASRGLADLYARTGRTEQALVLYEWSLGVLARTLGPTHYETQITRSRLEALAAGAPQP